LSPPFRFRSGLWRMTRPARFTTADLTRAVNAMRKAGCAVTGAEIKPDGSITVLTAANDETNDRGNPLERHLHG
jgi:hypothetical protein